MSATVTTRTLYTPGSWVGMAGARMWLVAELDLRDPVIAACWTLVAETATVDEVLAALVGGQLQPALNLAMVRLDDAGAEVVVRGTAWANVSYESNADRETLELRAGPGAFRDAKVDQFEVISLHLTAVAINGAPTLAVSTGVVPVSQLAIQASYPAIGATALTPEPPQASGSRFNDMFGKTVLPTEQEAQLTVVPESWMAGMRPQATDPSLGVTLPPPQTLSVPPSEQDYRSRFESTAPPLPPQPRTGGDIFNDVSWATVSETRNLGPDPYEQYHVAHPAPTSYLPPSALQLPPANPVPAGIDPELLQTVQRAPSTPTATGPIVSAVRCPSGHANPPAAQRCRICGCGIAPQTPVTVPRPKLGVLRLSTGEVVPLDRGVILGRAPGAPEGFGRDEPYRIQLPSPDGSISRKHIEVVLQDWSVNVSDLKSTNGTQVIPPGGMPELLPPGGRRVIDNGWTVILDATTFFRFEVTE